MKHPLFAAISVGFFWLLLSGVGYEAYAAQSPLVVRVTTYRPVYRLRRPVRITLTETNTSDHEVPVAIGCQILHGFITHDAETVWTFRDARLCATGEGLAPRARHRKRNRISSWIRFSSCSTHSL